MRPTARETAKIAQKTMTRSPYSGLPNRAFWRGGMAGASLVPPDLYQPKFPITKESRVFTAGSCFAQHVGTAMKTAGISVIDAEPTPRGMPTEVAKRHGYGIYSARFGNIYTVKQFRQMVDELTGSPIEDAIWEKGGRYWDAMRPGVDARGLSSVEHVVELRAQHLQAVHAALTDADVIVFTLGLTEAWEHLATGTVYPTAPGTIAGTYDAETYGFVNYDVDDVLDEFRALDAAIRRINASAKWVLTVSPVPLAATASGDHVLPATVRSKSVLRVVCDTLSRDHDHIDYFPSYEIVTSPAHPNGAFEDDLRSVKPDVVAQIMAGFLASHGLVEPTPSTNLPPAAEPDDDVICEEILLNTFRPGTS